MKSGSLWEDITQYCKIPKRRCVKAIMFADMEDLPELDAFSVDDLSQIITEGGTLAQNAQTAMMRMQVMLTLTGGASPTPGSLPDGYMRRLDAMPYVRHYSHSDLFITFTVIQSGQRSQRSSYQDRQPITTMT